MPPDPAIGLAIRRARERRQWTQAQLAAKVGVSLRSVSNWELGHHVPKNRTGALEQVLGVSLDGAPPAQDELTGEDDWERAVLSDPDLPPDVARSIVEASRAARAAYPAAGRSSPAAPTAGRRRAG